MDTSGDLIISTILCVHQTGVRPPPGSIIQPDTTPVQLTQVGSRPARKEIDQLWSKEAEERIEAYERGELRVSPAKEVFARIDYPQKK